jgi:hypothetical protein
MEGRVDLCGTRKTSETVSCSWVCRTGVLGNGCNMKNWRKHLSKPTESGASWPENFAPMSPENYKIMCESIVDFRQGLDEEMRYSGYWIAQEYESMREDSKGGN